MFITLHDEDGELYIQAESIEAFYKLDEETTTIRTKSQGFFKVTETIDEIKKMITSRDEGQVTVTKFCSGDKVDYDPIEELLSELPEQEATPLMDKDKEDPLPSFLQKRFLIGE